MNHDKLVRDRIPEIIKQNGDRATIHIASDKEYKQKLKDKLKEEVDEFLESNESDELVDLLEVIYALGDLSKTGKAELEKLRKEKESKRGSFKKRIILEKTE